MVCFYVRRVTLAASLVYWKSFLWGQVALQFLVLIFMLIFIQWHNPTNTPSYQRLETFNELVGLNLTILLMTFSDFQSDVNRR